jgi:hypothetical protein
MLGGWTELLYTFVVRRTINGRVKHWYVRTFSEQFFSDGKHNDILAKVMEIYHATQHFTEQL